MPANTLVLTACIAEAEGLRYTPAGVPALNLQLDSDSEVEEAGQQRTVKLAIKAVALGAVAERLAKAALGSRWQFQGFLANVRNGKSVVFHVKDFVQD